MSMLVATTIYENEAFELGEVDRSKVVDFGFKLRGDAPLGIQSVKPGCGGCTFPVLHDNGDITGTLNVASAAGRNYQTNQPHRGRFTKSITVYLDDGEPYYVTDKNRVLNVNRNKKFVELRISGTVIN